MHRRSAAACVVGLLPPSQLGQITTVPYLLALLAATLVVGLLPPLLLHKLRRSDELGFIGLVGPGA